MDPRDSSSPISQVVRCIYIASFITPYIIYLNVYVHWFPLAVISVTAGIGIFIALALPETAMKDMPDTFEEAEALTKNQEFWTLPIIKARRIRKSKNGQTNKCFQYEA